eukprot:gene26979-biopygen6123
MNSCHAKRGIGSFGSIPVVTSSPVASGVSWAATESNCLLHTIPNVVIGLKMPDGHYAHGLGIAPQKPGRYVMQ